MFNPILVILWITLMIYKILDWLGELLDEKQKSFVKNKLLKELLWIIEMKIDFEGRK